MDGYRRLDLGLLRAVLLAPDDPLPRLVAADWFRERGDNEAADIIAAGRVPVDDWTGNGAWQLSRVTMSPGCWDKRFCGDVVEPVAWWWGRRTQLPPAEVTDHAIRVTVATPRPDRLTPKQYLWTWRLLRRYRKQWAGKGKPALLKHAESILAMPVKG